ncbi:MAG: tyrosine-type recombinase/integrase [Rhizobiaceae bacterium]
MRKKLTPKSIDALKPAIGKRYEVRDTLVTGLVVRVSSTGGKVFYLNTRVDKCVKRIRIGPYPVISLSNARQRAKDTLADIVLGTYGQSSCGSPEIIVPVLGDVIEQFIDLYAKRNNKDWRGSQRVLNKFASLNKTPIDQISRKDVTRVLDRIVSGGAPIRANRALAAIKKLMNWCVDRGELEVSPIATMKPPSSENTRERVLTDNEMKTILHAATGEGFPFGQFTQLLFLTGQRRGEVAGMRHSEIDFVNGLWLLPAERTKNGSSHVVPLSSLTIDILQNIPKFSGSDLVFTTNGQTPISGFGRLKKRYDNALDCNTDDWRFHDIRRTVATNMAMMGIQPHIIEAVLNHKSGIVSGVAAVYNRHAYNDEKREALELWAQKIKELMKKSSVRGVERTLATSLAS